MRRATLILVGGTIRTPPLVLIVDDSETEASTLARLLRRHELEVRVAASGADIPRVLGDESKEVDGALVDQFLPDAHGTEIAKSIRAKNPEAVIAVVSGAAGEQELRASLFPENLAFFPKPINKHELDGWALRLIAGSELATFERSLAHLTQAHRLTQAEVKFLRAARSRSDYKAIASLLNISLNTAQTHGRNLLRKTRAGALRDLVERLRRAD